MNLLVKQSLTVDGREWTPPSDFIPVDTVSTIKPLDQMPDFIVRQTQKRQTKAQKLGLSFEREVNISMHEKLGDGYIPSPWFSFTVEGGGRKRVAQPDAYYINLTTGHITIFEVKYRHSARAWWQLKCLYLPLLKACYGDHWTYSVCGIIKWYNANTIWPETPMWVDTPAQAIAVKAKKTDVGAPRLLKFQG